LVQKNSAIVAGCASFGAICIFLELRTLYVFILLTYAVCGVSVQEILGGQYVATEKYDAHFFQTFRSGNIVEMTVDFARVCYFFVSSHFCSFCTLLAFNSMYACAI